jgi:ribosome modulation factor
VAARAHARGGERGIAQRSSGSCPSSNCDPANLRRHGVGPTRLLARERAATLSFLCRDQVLVLLLNQS